jgi:hypothetical protein
LSSPAAFYPTGTNILFDYGCVTESIRYGMSRSADCLDFAEANSG